jgi:hypothetical protein
MDSHKMWVKLELLSVPTEGDFELYCTIQVQSKTLALIYIPANAKIKDAKQY